MEQRREKLTEIEDLFVDLSDDLDQVLDFAELTRISERIQHYLELGSSVLGKSNLFVFYKDALCACLFCTYYDLFYVRAHFKNLKIRKIFVLKIFLS